MKPQKEIVTFCPENREAWRNWLAQNHQSEDSIWVIFHKKHSGKPVLTWSDAVDEAICFGWIDGLVRPIDEGCFMRFFSKRRPRSIWSKINKDKVQRLTAAGLMEQAGFTAVEIARQNGSWTTIDEANQLLVPEDLRNQLEANEEAAAYFQSLSKSDRRNVLQWLAMAKRPETRAGRIREIVDSAGRKMKPKALRWTKK